MNASRIFWKVTRWARAARFWLFLLLAFAAWAGFGGAEAHAQDGQCFNPSVNTGGEGTDACPSRQSAYEQILAVRDYNLATFGSCPGVINVVHVAPAGTGAAYGRYTLTHDGTGGVVCRQRLGNSRRNYHLSDECPEGGQWSETLKSCFEPEHCEARNGAANGFPLDPVSKPFRERCISGCMFKLQSGTGGCTVLGGAGDGAMHCNGVFQWEAASDGLPCTASPSQPDDTAPEDVEESCSTRDGGQIKFCKKNDGRECFSANGGAMICWGEGETGQRTNGDNAQTRGPGAEAPTPTPPAPPETFDPTKTTGPETTTTTTTNPDGSTRTTVTTVINNTTTNGTNAPGTPGSTPPQSGGDPDGDEEGNSATGGGDCDTPPIVTGDAVLGMVATQAWATRCAVEAGNTAAVTGDVGDCKSPFSVEGDHANAQQLRALRAKICSDEDRVEADVSHMKDVAASADSDISDMEDEFGTDVFGEGSGVGSISTGRFGGGGGCPALSVSVPGVGTWTPPAAFCDVIAALRLLFLAVSTIWALRIVGSE